MQDIGGLVLPITLRRELVAPVVRVDVDGATLVDRVLSLFGQRKRLRRRVRRKKHVASTEGDLSRPSLLVDDRATLGILDKGIRGGDGDESRPQLEELVSGVLEHQKIVALVALALDDALERAQLGQPGGILGGRLADVVEQEIEIRREIGDTGCIHELRTRHTRMHFLPKRENSVQIRPIEPNIRSMTQQASFEVRKKLILTRKIIVLSP